MVCEEATDEEYVLVFELLTRVGDEDAAEGWLRANVRGETEDGNLRDPFREDRGRQLLPDEIPVVL